MTIRVSPSVREQVRQRANDRCEYCRKPSITSGYRHHVDHIIPPLHGGTSELDNLAWACFQCNTSKGPNISSYDLETSALTPLFNPRTQNWHDHFKMREALIEGITPVGRVTERVLQFNNPDFVKTRRGLMNSGIW